jgi:hypothetical protein
MSNTNGLIPCTAVCATGKPDSNYYLRKGEPLSLPSPLTLVSPDGTKTGGIAVGNDGTMVFANDNNNNPLGGFFMECAEAAQSDLIVASYPDSAIAGGIIVNNMAGAGFDESAQYYCDLDGAALVASSTAIVRLGNSSSATPVVEVVGSEGEGKVYDSVYNPVNKIITLQPATTGNVVLSLNPYPLDAGTYRLELFTEGTIVPAASTRLRIAVATIGTVSIVDYSQASINDVAAAGSIGFSLNSGSFTLEAGNYNIALQSSGANWTASTWGLQLVKLV